MLDEGGSLVGLRGEVPAECSATSDGWFSSLVPLFIPKYGECVAAHLADVHLTT